MAGTGYLGHDMSTGWQVDWVCTKESQRGYLNIRTKFQKQKHIMVRDLSRPQCQYTGYGGVERYKKHTNTPHLLCERLDECPCLHAHLPCWSSTRSSTALWCRTPQCPPLCLQHAVHHAPCVLAMDRKPVISAPSRKEEERKSNAHAPVKPLNAQRVRCDCVQQRDYAQWLWRQRWRRSV